MSEFDRFERLLKQEPELLSKEDLYGITLSFFNEKIGAGGFLSSKRIMIAYLRWLEIQRTGKDHKLNHHWVNTQNQWIGALKARGFEEQEIIRDVMEWTNAAPLAEGRVLVTEALIHGVFEGRNSAAQGQGNFPPQFPAVQALESNTMMKRPLQDQNEYYGGHQDKRGKHNPAPYTAGFSNEVVPKDYVCKRCTSRGHWLWNCPTNLNPKYDTLPEHGYHCNGCGRGDHYYTLCPNNPHPGSIYNKRVEEAREKEREKERQRKLAEAFLPPKKKQPPKVQRLRFDDTIEDTNASEIGANKEAVKFPGNTFDFVAGYISSNPKKDLFPSHQKSLPLQFKRYDPPEETDGILDAMDYMQRQPHPGNPPELAWIRSGVPHPICLAKLSKDIVNKPVKRPTALEMWDRHDEELGKLPVEMVLDSSSEEEEGDEERMDTDSSSGDVAWPPQVLRITHIESDTTTREIEELFAGYEVKITAVSVWKPSFVKGDSLISAFVSLKNASPTAHQRICPELTGVRFGSTRIRVTYLNPHEAFQKALEQYEEDDEGNKDFEENGGYIQYHEQERQILQHLRMTAVKEENELDMSACC